jgi:uncharacterized protein YcbK (DUF882 family)
MLLSRRHFIKAGALAAMSAYVPSTFAAGRDFAARDRSLAFYNTHTGERLKTVFWSGGDYVAESLHDINHILRDPRNDQVHDIDRRLIDVLHALRSVIEAREPFHVISGYRSPESNAFLRSRSSGVAESSLHLVGKAIDIRLPSQKLSHLRGAAMALKAGGIGYYPKSNFIHVDIGHVRYW